MSNEEMAVRIQEGKRELLPELWEQVRRSVMAQAGRLLARSRGRCDACGVTVDDFMQAGFLALLDAVATFEPARGCKLLSCLSYPLRKHWSVLLCYQSERQRGEPLNLSVSLDETADDEDGALRAETIPDATALEAFEDILGREWLRQLRQIEEEEIDRLSPALAKLIRCRYFEGMTLEQLARLRGVSAERVRQLEQRALEQLRKPRPALRLWPFLAGEGDAFSLRGTGVLTFRAYGSATERAAERIERRRTERKRVQEQADRKLRELIEASEAGESIDLEAAFEEWRATLNGNL